ncbi:MAG: PhnA domain protein, partial [Elusimicrobia bacterium CG11_big_fil_rev_8_21_14_0_20_64_6]
SEEVKDSNGNILSEGDTVTLIKDLNVKGANFTAKRGTIVRKIALTDNPEQIEGKVNGTQIVLLTKYLKKA